MLSLNTPSVANRNSPNSPLWSSGRRSCRAPLRAGCWRSALPLLVALLLGALLPASMSNRAFAQSAGDRPARNDSVLDLIPDDVRMALLVPSLKLLERRADPLLQASGASIPKTSQAYSQLLQYIGCPKGIDREAALAVMLPAIPSDTAPSASPWSLSDWLRIAREVVFVVSYKSLDEVAANYGLKPGDLTERAMTSADGHFLYATSNSLYVCRDENSLEQITKKLIARGKQPARRSDKTTLREQLTELQRAKLLHSEVILHCNTRGWRQGWTNGLTALESALAKNTALTKPGDRVVADHFMRTLRSVRSATVGVRLGEAVTISTNIQLDPGKDIPQVRKFLSALAGGAETSRLRGLPADNLVMAFAAKTDARYNAPVGRTLLSAGLRQLGNHWIRQLIGSDDPLLLAAFTGIWENTQGSRTAVYFHPDGDGAASFIAVLDARDQQDSTGPSKSPPDSPSAEQGEEPKTVNTAAAATAQAKTAREPDLAKIIEPWTRLPGVVLDKRQETWKGVDIHFLQRRKPTASPSEKQPLKTVERLLGSQWNRVRVAVIDRQWIVLIGSQTDVLHKTLDNLLADRPGLDGHKSIVAAHEMMHEDRKVEFHLGLPNALRLRRYATGSLQAEKAVPLPDAGGLISAGWAIKPDHLHVDINISLPALQALGTTGKSP